MSKCIHGEENCVRCAMDPIEQPEVKIHLLLDVSASMAGRWSQTIEGLNEYVDALRQDPQPCNITLTTFAGPSHLKAVYSGVCLDSIPKFTLDNCPRPVGESTALWDAIGKTIQAIDTASPVLIVIVTDGANNSSVQFDATKVDALIDAKKKLGNYTFVYLGVDKAAWDNTAMVHSLSSNSSNIAASNYDAGTFKSLARHTNMYRSFVSASVAMGGPASTEDFFTQDAADEKTGEADGGQ